MSTTVLDYSSLLPCKQLKFYEGILFKQTGGRYLHIPDVVTNELVRIFRNPEGRIRTPRFHCAKHKRCELLTVRFDECSSILRALQKKHYRKCSC